MDFSDMAFRVVADDYVTSDSGTGIVHCAPAFGEDDYRVCIENQIITKVCKSCYTFGLNPFSPEYYLFLSCCIFYCLFCLCNSNLFCHL